MEAIRFWVADTTAYYDLDPKVEDDVLLVLPIKKQKPGILNPVLVLRTVEKVHVSIHQGRRMEFADTDVVVEYVRALAQLRCLAIEARKIFSPIGYRRRLAS